MIKENGKNIRRRLEFILLFLEFPEERSILCFKMHSTRVNSTRGSIYVYNCTNLSTNKYTKKTRNIFLNGLLSFTIVFGFISRNLLILLTDQSVPFVHSVRQAHFLSTVSTSIFKFYFSRLLTV